MTTPETARNTRTWLESYAPAMKINGGDVSRFSVFFLLGSLVMLHPLLVVGFVAAAAALCFGWLARVYARRNGLEVWQVLLLIALTGYILLNYGFENLAIQVGIPIIVSYLLMFASLVLAVSSRGNLHLMRRALREPVVLCLLGLLLLSCLHLIFDIPSYGMWAVRDASMFIDGIFLVLGLLWSMKRNRSFLMKWLMLIFILNLVYCFALPWGEQIRAWSPKSGVFHPVPLLGNYHANDIYLLAGALFCMFLGRYVVRLPRWIMLVLAMAQLFGLAINQFRAMYIALLIVLVILVLLGEAGKSRQLVLVLSFAFVSILLLTTLGLEIPGRIGPVNIAFLKENVRSIVGAEEKPAGAAIDGRFDWYDQVMHRISLNPVLGEGFGLPLIDYIEGGEEEQVGTAVRQPHNSNISVLARLGAIGLAIWVVLHLCVARRFIYAFRQRRCYGKPLSDTLLWLFFLYLISMISITVEPGLEFPSGAIPFYFFVGLTLGLIRWQVPQKKVVCSESEASLVGLPEAT